jgi:hypothetical protein
MIFHGNDSLEHDNGNNMNTKAAHPSETTANAISIFRVVTSSLFLRQIKTFPASHNTLNWSEIIPSNVAKPRLTDQHLLILKGSLKYELQPLKDTVVIWKGYSKRVLGGDVENHAVYPFMVTIYSYALGLDGAFLEQWMGGNVSSA